MNVSMQPAGGAAAEARLREESNDWKKRYTESSEALVTARKENEELHRLLEMALEEQRRA